MTAKRGARRASKVKQQKQTQEAGQPTGGAPAGFIELEYMRQQLDYGHQNEEARTVIDTVMYALGVGTIDPNTLLSILANITVFSTMLMEKNHETGERPSTEERLEVLGRVSAAFSDLLNLHESELPKFIAFKQGRESQLIVQDQEIVIATEMPPANIH